jgi:hypothetical protein
MAKDIGLKPIITPSFANPEEEKDTTELEGLLGSMPAPTPNPVQAAVSKATQDEAVQPLAPTPTATPVAAPVAAPAAAPVNKNVAKGFKGEDYADLAEIKKMSAAESPNANAAAEAKAAEDKKTKAGETATAVAGAAIDIMGEVGTFFSDMAYKKYAQELQTYIDNGKYWFDPRYESHVELNEALAALPSAQEAMTDASYVSPATTKIPGSVAAGYVDPLSMAVSYAVAGKEGGQLQGYMMQKVGERGLQGLKSTGSVWGLLFGLVGVVESIMTWNTAKDEDKKNKEQARDAYMNALKEYTEQRNQLKLKSQNEQTAYVRQLKDIEAAKDQEQELEKLNAAQKNRLVFTSFVDKMRNTKEPESQYLAF